MIYLPLPMVNSWPFFVAVLLFLAFFSYVEFWFFFTQWNVNGSGSNFFRTLLTLPNHFLTCLRESFVIAKNVCVWVWVCCACTKDHSNRKSIKKCQFWCIWIFVCYEQNILAKPLKQYTRAHGKTALFNFSKVLRRLHQFKMKKYDDTRLIFLVFSD